MGFAEKQIKALLKNEKVEDVNQAVDLLIMGPNGYKHKFLRSKNNKNSDIC
jgi:hypothetical protein